MHPANERWRLSLARHIHRMIPAYLLFQVGIDHQMSLWTWNDGLEPEAKRTCWYMLNIRWDSGLFWNVLDKWYDSPVRAISNRVTSHKRFVGSNHRQLDCFCFVFIFQKLDNKNKYENSALLVIYEGNPPVGFPSQRASNAEGVSMSWRHHTTGPMHGEHTGSVINSKHYWNIYVCVFVVPLNNHLTERKLGRWN